MATMANPTNGALEVTSSNSEDPFVSAPTHGHPAPHRYASFDNNLFSLYSGNSPSQAKRALEAHLKDTERRIQEASKLGSSLLHQRKELSARLKEVEQHKDENEIGPELRQKLAELEKEYTEVGRESARAFLPKSRIALIGESEASVLSGDSRASPSKVSAPSSRKQRNQPQNRVHDIEFATEISTSLLAQVRQLQGVLVEKDDALKQTTSEKAQLEMDYAAIRQRLRQMDDNEQKYKDENWNLETQLQEITASLREASDREHRLNTSIKSSLAEKDAFQRELEDLRQSHERLVEDHDLIKKQHESELYGLRRDIAGNDSEREAMQKRIEELTAQNTELAKAVSYRWNQGNQQSSKDLGSDLEDDQAGRTTPEHSPPPSPTKGTPRHGMLESETLKSSLTHAHRMIQNLKNNIHREKTEKIELKRMLQDARDELEARRSNSGMDAALAKKRRTEPDNVKFRKPLRPDQLGANRQSREDIIMDDEDWEDHDGERSPSRRAARHVSGTMPGAFAVSGAEETETTDAFETANERDDTTTETEAFQTGAEDLEEGNSEDDLTETETGALRSSTVRSARQSSVPVSRAGDRTSYMSTASTSADETDDLRTPIQAQMPKYKLKNGRARRSVRNSELFGTPVSNASHSPAVSFSSSTHSTPVPAGQSLGDELDGLSDDEDASVADETPSRMSVESGRSSPESVRQRYVSGSTVTGAIPVLTPRPQMVDSGMMTEPWEPESTSVVSSATGAIGGALSGAAGYLLGRVSSNKDAEAAPDASEERAVAEDEGRAEEIDEPKALLEPQIETPKKEAVERSVASPKRGGLQQLTEIVAQQTEPLSPPRPSTAQRPAQFTSIVSQQTEPLSPARPRTAQKPALVAMSPYTHVETTPLAGVSRRDVTPTAAVNYQDLLAKANTVSPTPPVAQSSVPQPAVTVPLAMSSITSQEFEPSLDVVEDQAVMPPRRSSRRVGTLFEIHDPDEDPYNLASQGKPRQDSEVLPPTNGLRSRKSVDTERSVHEPTMYGGAKGTNLEEPTLVFGDETDEETSAPVEKRAGARMPFAEVSNNTSQGQPAMSRTKSMDEGTQTAVTSDEIENLIKQKSKASVAVGADSGTQYSPRRSHDSSVFGEGAYIKTPRRPSSSNSVRKAATSPPPLPPDVHQKIAMAAQKAPGATAATPATQPGSMGPPALPASAYKNAPVLRPRTPSINAPQSPVARGGTTPRPHAGPSRTETRSPVSRRTSVSSFASELDERFNITRQGLMLPSDIEPATDPRMIQAITQTMIGEYLWKYTRKTGSSQTSSTRHRRFFWVHPYTRTLYWSEQDPSTAGQKQLKAKSVQIESVRVISDDNSYPPGLHRKSIVVVTPGREVVFTAPTGQRHETWFNALSYLLLRTAPEKEADRQRVVDETAELTAADVDEFNPQLGYGRSMSRNTGRSRLSLSSYNSRTTRTSSPQRPHRNEVPSLAARQSNAAQRGTVTKTATTNSQQQQQQQQQQQHLQPSTPQRNASVNQGSLSGRLSSLGGMVRGSFSIRSRTSMSQRREGGDRIYDASVVADSAEDLRQVIEQQEREADRLENVRACCDGEFYCSSCAGVGREGLISGNRQA
ncbi:hypothetical protein M8818_005707 [Zalaria obscura]|uniref:Uncharacterized protein n=1 Tax=Zalaria obscura TaxID=2024903 RepID=A0ACC3S9B7_9PEZI